MSGGHWNYAGPRIRDELEMIAEDSAVARRFPALAAELERLARALYRVEHDLDWDLSADSGIRDDRAFEEQALGELAGRPDAAITAAEIRALVCRDGCSCHDALVGRLMAWAIKRLPAPDATLRELGRLSSSQPPFDVVDKPRCRHCGGPKAAHADPDEAVPNGFPICVCAMPDARPCGCPGFEEATNR